MPDLKKLLRVSVATTAATIITLAISAAPGSADTTGIAVPSSSTVAQALANTGADANASPVASAASDGAITDQSDGQAATLPADPTSGITDTIDGETIGLGIPDAQDASDAEDISNATAVYSGGAPDTAIAAQADTDGVSEDITITGTDAPTTYDFPLDLPAGVSLQAEPNGSYAIVQDLADGTSEQIGQIEAPWATDANGNPVPTSYTLDGNTLIQTIDFTDSTAFPVVADPSIQRSQTQFLYFLGFIPYAIKFNHAATGAARNPAALLAFGATICAVFGVESFGAGCAIAAGEMGVASAVAGNAYGDGKCLEIYVPWIPREVSC